MLVSNADGSLDQLCGFGGRSWVTQYLTLSSHLRDGCRVGLTFDIPA